MTNEEVIEELLSRKVSMSMCISVDDCRKSNMAIEKAIESLQENTKLKAEIEQWQSTNLKLTCELTRVECENHQLKKDKSNKNCVDCKTYIEHDEDSNCIKCKNHSNFMEGGAE